MSSISRLSGISMFLAFACFKINWTMSLCPPMQAPTNAVRPIVLALKSICLSELSTLEYQINVLEGINVPGANLQGINNRPGM